VTAIDWLPPVIGNHRPQRAFDGGQTKPSRSRKQRPTNT